MTYYIEAYEANWTKTTVNIIDGKAETTSEYEADRGVEDIRDQYTIRNGDLDNDIVMFKHYNTALKVLHGLKEGWITEEEAKAVKRGDTNLQALGLADVEV